MRLSSEISSDLDHFHTCDLSLNSHIGIHVTFRAVFPNFIFIFYIILSLISLCVCYGYKCVCMRESR